MYCKKVSRCLLTYLLTCLAEAAAASNVAQLSLDGHHVAIVAARDLYEGEELFMPYGAGYWISRLASQQAGGTCRVRGRGSENSWPQPSPSPEPVGVFRAAARRLLD